MIAHHAYPAEPWAVREQELDLGVLAQSESIFALANGHLGLRGNLDEGEPRALSGTYLGGFYESYPLSYGERGYGFPEDGQTIVNVTDGKLIRLLVEDEPLDVHRGRLESHERVLDLRTGILERNVRWTSQAGRAVRVTSRRLVSFRDRSVAAICYEVEAIGAPMRIALQSNLLANQTDTLEHGDPRLAADLGKVLATRLSVHDGLRVVLAHTTRRSGLSLAAGMEHVIDAEHELQTRTESEDDLGRVTISAQLTPGRPLRMVKLLAYHWSSQESIEWLRDQVDASLESAVAEGFDGLAASQRQYLDDYWVVADVELDGDVEIQQALRFALFNVLQATARAETRAIAAKGLTGPGYDGHAFWDTESFVLPMLTYTRPELARDALIWRHTTLDLARERARELGLRGAAFPWRTIHGEECSSYWPAGTAAFHVNADIADAVRRYVLATGDEDFERDYGTELLIETARLWISLGYQGTDGHFRIDGVTGPDEYSALVDNNVYTNLMAQGNLRAAADAAERGPECARRLEVEGSEIAAWRKAAQGMFVPYDEWLGVHPQDQDFTAHERWDFDTNTAEDYPLLLTNPYLTLYRRQVVKQADLVLALFRRGDAFTAEEKRRDFEYYEALTVRDSSLSACIQSVVAAEVGHLDLAYDYLAEAALMDLRDLDHDVRDGVHVASQGGALLAAIAGFGGMRDWDGEVSFAPRLPRGIERLVFQVGLRGRRLRVEVTAGAATYTLREDDSELEVSHWGDRMELAPGASTERPDPAGATAACPGAAGRARAGTTEHADSIQAVILDLDGVLIDSEQAWGEVRRELVMERGGRWHDHTQRDMMGMSSVEWSRYIHDELGVEMLPQDISADVVRRLALLYRERLPLVPGAHEAVERLAARWPLALASSSNRELIDLVLEVAHLAQYFRATVSSEEVARGKPAPDVYLEAARSLETEPSRCAAIEDSHNGILSGAAAGMRVIAIPNREFAPGREALAKAACVLESLDELTPEVIEG